MYQSRQRQTAIAAYAKASSMTISQYFLIYLACQHPQTSRTHAQLRIHTIYYRLVPFVQSRKRIWTKIQEEQAKEQEDREDWKTEEKI